MSNSNIIQFCCVLGVINWLIYCDVQFRRAHCHHYEIYPQVRIGRGEKLHKIKILRIPKWVCLPGRTLYIDWLPLTVNICTWRKVTFKLWTEFMRFGVTTKDLLNLTLVGPCIVIYLYSKTNQMHSISNIFYFGIHCTCFGQFFHLSSGVYCKTKYSIRYMSYRLASKQPQNPYDMYLMLYIQS
jgi:hypothetical protein